MSSTDDLPATKARTRLHHIGLSPRDMHTIQSLLRLRPELDARYEFVSAETSSAHILFVNADDSGALATWEKTWRQYPSLRAIMVSRHEQHIPGHAWLLRPIDFRNFIGLLDHMSAIEGSLPVVTAGSMAPSVAVPRAIPHATRPLRVLIVDHSHPVRVFLQHKMKQLADVDMPLTIETAESGEAALERVERQHYDLVLLDINMPGLDGYETCKRLKQIRPVRVIMLTTRNSETDFQNGYSAGCDHYLSKPPQDDQLRHVLMIAATQGEPDTL